MTVWISGSAQDARQAGEMFLLACAKAAVAGVAEPALPDSDFRYIIQIGADPSQDPEPGCDILFAATAEAAAWAGAARRLVVYDSRVLAEPKRLRPGAAVLGVPGLSAAELFGIMAWAVNLDAETFPVGWSRRLRSEASEALSFEIQAARTVQEKVSSMLGASALVPARGEGRFLCLSGAQALAWGALAAGCTCLAVPDRERGSGPSSAMLALAKHEGLAWHPAADGSAALALAAGAALAGARSLVDLSAASLAASAGLFDCCARKGIPVVVLAADDGWRWPEGLRVEQLRPASVREACRMAAEAFNTAEKNRVPVVIRAGSSLLSRWESLPDFSSQTPIDRGVWACSEQAPAGARVVPGHAAPIRIIADRGPEGPAGMPETAAGTSRLFPVPARTTLEEREPADVGALLPEGLDAAPCVWVLRLLARAWSEQCLHAKDIFVVAGESCLSSEQMPRTYGIRVPAGFAADFAAGVKLANPELSVTALDDGPAVFSRGLSQLLQSMRIDPDSLFFVSTREPLPVDLIGTARLAGATFLARIAPGDGEPAARVVAQALAHKGFSLVEYTDSGTGPDAAVSGVIHEQAGRPDLPLEMGEAPIRTALDARSRRFASLPDGMF